jgi:peroxiredoxin
MVIMNRLMRFVPLIIFTVQLLVVTETRAQPSPFNYDLDFEARMRGVLAEMQDVDNDEARSRQRAFAQEAFNYYRQNLETTTGGHAAETAFRIWGSIGTTEDVESALPAISMASPLWSTILNGVDNTYIRAGRREAYFELLVRLEPALTDPGARSEVLASLGRRYIGSQQFDEALALFNQIVALDADQFQVERAKGYIYEIENLAIGDMAPDFIASTLQGNSLRLSDLQGQPVLLEFWATWCVPCIPEIAHLKQLEQVYGNVGLHIIGISMDANLMALEQLMEKEGISWVQVQQVEGMQGEIARLFNVQGIPRSVLLDKQGRIVAKDIRGDDLETAVAEIMKDSQN